MDEVNDDAKASFRRIGILTGPGRRRRRAEEPKARIVAVLEPDCRSPPPFVLLGSAAAVPPHRGHIKVIGTSDYFALWVDDGSVDASARRSKK